MQGLTIHDLNMIVLTFFRLYRVCLHLANVTLVTNIGVKQAYMLGSDGLRPLSEVHKAFSYVIFFKNEWVHIIYNKLPSPWSRVSSANG